MIEITANDPRIDDYRNLRFTPAGHTRQSIFVAEGEKTVRRLLRSSVEVVSVLAQSDFYEKYSDAIAGKGVPDDSCFVADKAVLEGIVGYRLHQGILALGRRLPETPISEMSGRVLVLDRVIDAENVGAIIRTAAAFGIDSIVLDKPSAHPFLRRAVRVSLGACFSIKYCISGSLLAAANELKSQGRALIAAEQDTESVSVYDYRFPQRFALIMGSEGFGVARELLDVCDSIVELPVSGVVDSLNVAATASALLFEQARQLAEANLGV